MASSLRSKKKLRRALFLDRDGIINPLQYNAEQGTVDSPCHPNQFRLHKEIGAFLRKAKVLGYMLIVISNQPGMAKGKCTKKSFDAIQKKMHHLLQREGVQLDGEYYCHHHPQAVKKVYRKICACRKPKPGMLQKAAQELPIDMKHSFLIGDGINDILAGRKAGCKTILFAHLKEIGYLVHLERMAAKPHFIAHRFQDLLTIIQKL